MDSWHTERFHQLYHNFVDDVLDLAMDSFFLIQSLKLVVWMVNKYNFIEIKLLHGCSPVNLLHIFRKPFLKNTSARLLLDCVHFSCNCIEGNHHVNFLFLNASLTLLCILIQGLYHMDIISPNQAPVVSH